jgi:LysM repeat protein
MSTDAYYRRGGMLRGVAWIAVAVGAFVLVTALFAFRGGRIQQELQETGQKLQEQYPKLKDKLAELPDLPAFPDLPHAPAIPGKNAGDAPTGNAPATTNTKPAALPKSGTETAGAGAATTAKAPASPASPAYSVEDPPPVARAQHKVTKGETLYSLAETYYEDGSLWKLIARANNLKDPADLREGMVVVIPGK